MKYRRSNSTKKISGSSLFSLSAHYVFYYEGIVNKAFFVKIVTEESSEGASTSWYVSLATSGQMLLQYLVLILFDQIEKEPEESCINNILSFLLFIELLAR